MIEDTMNNTQVKAKQVNRQAKHPGRRKDSTITNLLTELSVDEVEQM